MMLFSRAAGRHRDAPVQHRNQALLAIFLLRVVLRLHHAVGEDRQPVARLQRHRC